MRRLKGFIQGTNLTEQVHSWMAFCPSVEGKGWQETGCLPYQPVCQTCMADNPAAIANLLLKDCLAVFTLRRLAACRCSALIVSVMQLGHGGHPDKELSCCSNVSITLICQLLDTDVCSIAEIYMQSSYGMQSSSTLDLLAHTWSSSYALGTAEKGTFVAVIGSGSCQASVQATQGQSRRRTPELGCAMICDSRQCAK